MLKPKLFLLSLALSTPLFAQDIQIIGTIDQTPKILQNQTAQASAQQAHIKLLKIKLSDKAINSLNERKTALKNQQLRASYLPPKVQLGMNGVPVLNQGPYGSCATFANTAAVDAALNKGDYISQVCQLQLGTYLEKNSYLPSGWNGSFGHFVLSQMMHFGMVSKDQQKTLGCGGLTEYPEHGQPPETGMPLEQYHELSNDLFNNGVDWSPILNVYQAMLDRTDTNKTLNDVKKALNANERVTFGVLLVDFDLGFMGAVGSHHANFDSWVLTPEIARDLYLRPEFGGHEMIITGYDDDAVATDDEGHPHKGLLTLRNSWGDNFGDKGDFYMSYDYFKVLVIEAQRIRSMPADGAGTSARG